MPKTKQFKIDATTPLYAVVGAGDLAVERTRVAVSDVQARVAKVNVEPKTLESIVAELQSDAKALPGKVEVLVNDTVDSAASTYGDLAARGKDLVARIRKQQATKDLIAAIDTTIAKAKTTRTQTVKSAKQSASETRTSATKTANTAKRNVKATTTSAKKAAAASKDAATAAADKVGD